MDVKSDMNIFISANFFIHCLDITKVSVRVFDKSEGSNWIVNIGGNVLLWFDNKEELINFADKILLVVKASDIKEKVNNETNS